MNTMSKDNEVIKEYTISKRLGEASTSFTVTFVTPLAPDAYDTGEDFEFVITDPTLRDGYTKFRGKILSVERNDKDHNRIYGLSGSDVGRLLTRQPFTLDCSISDGEEYTVEEVIELILEETGITLGRGQMVLGEL